MDINYFKAIQNAIGASTSTEVSIREAKRDIAEGMLSSIGLITDATRNGHPQMFALAKEISLFKYNILAFPDDELNIGDVLEFHDEKWIVKDVKLSNPIQRVGIIYLVNLTLRFQNHNSKVIERPAVLDKGQYSTTIGEEKDIRYPNEKIKIYLPYDEDTKYIHMDKRIATGVCYDKYGNPNLETYRITKVNHTTVNFGKGSHLLELTVESDQYSPSKDNLEYLVCNYIAPTKYPTPSGKQRCSIEGRKKLLLGSKRTYKASFYTERGTEDTDAVPVWDFDETEGITANVSDGQLTLAATEDEGLIGKILTLTLKDADGNYAPCVMEIEVTV